MKWQIGEYLFPTRCFLCRKISGGEALCPSCRQEWDRCVRSGASTAFFPLPNVDHLCTLSPYSTDADHPVSAFLRRAKRDRRDQAVAFAASQAAALLRQELCTVWRDAVIVPVPRSQKAIREFGHDQSVCLAETLAKELGARCVQALERSGSEIQKTLSRAERTENAMRAYRVKAEYAPLVRARHVILTDDVVTTGATVSACAALLHGAGARTVDVFALARTL